jgi:hypothetical protein
VAGAVEARLVGDDLIPLVIVPVLVVAASLREGKF